MKRKVNASNIGLCLLAMLLFKYGFWQLSYLTNIPLANTLRATGSISSPQFTTVEISQLAVTTILAQTLGIFVAGVLSFILSARKRIDLFELLVAFVLFWALSGLQLTSGRYFIMMADIPGSGLKDYRFFLVNGTLLTFIGILLLLFKRRVGLKYKDRRIQAFATNS